MLTLFILLGVPIFVSRQHLRPRPLLSLLAGTALTTLLLLPVLPAQLSHLAGYTRTIRTITLNSAHLADYLDPGQNLWGRSLLPWLNHIATGQRLYPGSGLLIFALLGVFGAWRSGRRRLTIYLILATILALLLSLGYNFRLGDWQPYQLLRNNYPGFKQFRSPFRFALFVQLNLLILAAFGLSLLWRWRPPTVRWLTATLLTLALPTQLYIFPHDRLEEDWISWLNEQPSGAVAMLPFPASGSAADHQSNAIAMLQALHHNHPLANGYSGFFPTAYRHLRNSMSSFPSEQSIGLLGEADIAYLNRRSSLAH